MIARPPPLPLIRRRKAREAQYSRAEIFAAYGGTCAYCDAPAEHLDHVVPTSKGGPDVSHNLLPACAPCNLGKSNKSLAEWALSWLTPHPIHSSHTEGEGAQ